MRPPVTFVRLSDAVHRALNEETIVLGARSADAFALNRVGTWLWEKLEREVSLDTLAQAMADQFRIDVETARVDCERFLRDLEAQGLVRRCP